VPFKKGHRLPVPEISDVLRAEISALVEKESAILDQKLKEAMASIETLQEHKKKIRQAIAEWQVSRVATIRSVIQHYKGECRQ
jgi:FtsZ-binding cell division protein ZapB